MSTSVETRLDTVAVEQEKPFDFSEVDKDDFTSLAKEDTWYIIALTALLAFDEAVGRVPELWQYISSRYESDNDKLLFVARRLRETLLKCSVLLGIPKTINGLSSLDTAITQHNPTLIPALHSDQPLRSSLTLSQKQARGLSFFKSIYKQHTTPILTSMTTSSAGDLPHFIIEDIYGGILAEDSILSLRETAVLEFAACLAGNAAPQAKGHMYGCRNVGVSAGDVRNAVRIVRSVGRILGREVGARGDMGFLKRVEEW